MAGLCHAGLAMVRCSASAACERTVLRVSRVCTKEMPMLLPMLRIRLYNEVPCARISGLKVAKVAAASGTNTETGAKTLYHARPDDIAFGQVE